MEELDGASPPNVTAAMLTGLGIDEYFARTDSNGTMSYLTSRLGSTVALSSSSGTLATQYSYEPFGATTIAGSSSNPFQFTGRENDGTGLYYYRARYYSPTFGRFISQDPLGFVGSGPNLYAYVANDPETLVDRKGLSEVPSWMNPSSPDYNPNFGKIMQQQLNNPFLSCPLPPKPPCKLTPAQYVNFVNGLGDWGTVGLVLGGLVSAPSLDPPAVVGIATVGAGATDLVYYKTFMFLHCG